MANGIEYSFEGMNDTAQEGEGFRAKFEQQITDLENTINQIGNYWVSPETGTYEEFVAMFNEKKPKLLAVADKLRELDTKMTNQAETYHEAAIKSMNSFQ